MMMWRCSSSRFFSLSTHTQAFPPIMMLICHMNVKYAHTHISTTWEEDDMKLYMQHAFHYIPLNDNNDMTPHLFCSCWAPIPPLFNKQINGLRNSLSVDDAFLVSLSACVWGHIYAYIHSLTLIHGGVILWGILSLPIGHAQDSNESSVWLTPPSESHMEPRMGLVCVG